MNMIAIYNNKVQEEIHLSKTHNSSPNSHIQPVKTRDSTSNSSHILKQTSQPNKSPNSTISMEEFKQELRNLS